MEEEYESFWETAIFQENSLQQAWEFGKNNSDITKWHL